MKWFCIALLLLAAWGCTETGGTLQPQDAGSQDGAVTDDGGSANDAGGADTGRGDAAPPDARMLVGCERILGWPETGPTFVEQPITEFPHPSVLSDDYDLWWHYSSGRIRHGCVDYRVDLNLVAESSANGLRQAAAQYLVHVCNTCDDARVITWRSLADWLPTMEDESGRADELAYANFGGIMLSFALSTSEPRARRRTAGCPVAGCGGVATHTPEPGSDTSMNEWRLLPGTLTTLYAGVSEFDRVLNQRWVGRLPADHPYSQDPFSLDDARGIDFILPRFGGSPTPWERSYAVECARSGLAMPRGCGVHTLPGDENDYETLWHHEPSLRLPPAIIEHAEL